MPWSREENILRHYLFADKIFQNCLQLDTTHLYDNNLLLRQETQKRFHVLEADIITIKKKDWFDVFNSKNEFFHRTCFKWPPLRLSQ